MGYELRVEGATNNLAVFKNELAAVIESKKLIKAGLQVKDGDGNPLFSFQKNEGYYKIEHPNFTWWDYSGSVRIDDIERDLKDFVVKLKKSDMDRLETVENRIKMILSGAGLTTPEIDNLLYRIKNTPTKEAVIDESIRRLKKKQSNIRYKKHITIELLVRNGLTLGRIQDWEELVFKQHTLIGDLPGQREQKQLYRKFWRRVAVRAMTLTTVLNLAMALFDDPDDEEKYWETVKRRYKTAWDRGYLSWLDVDISPVYFALGGDRDKRAYFSVIGHFRDPVEFLRYPAMSAKNKGSVLSRVILESLVGSDWRGRPFTGWDELAGLDNETRAPSYKGLYKSTSKKFGYKKGDPKGGKLKGRLTKSRYQGRFGPIDYGQVPSFTVHQIKQMQPIQIQMLIGYPLGEEQGLEAVLKSLGIGSAVVLDPKYYKNSGL